MKQIKHIKDLKPDKRNARKHNPRNIGMIERSLGEVGAARSIVIDEDGKILAGNGTVEGAAQAGITKVQVVDADGETIVAVRRTGLTDEQKTKLALYDNRTAELAEWDADVLEEIGEEIDLSGMFTGDEFGQVTGAEYTIKTDPVIYEPSDNKPTLGALYSMGRAARLLGDIDASSVSEDEKAFLRVAAWRHAVISYSAVADYYAHASAEMQRLMEDSALVIIDYKKAVELAYAKVSERIMELAGA